jgi:hypothetical protein
MRIVAPGARPMLKPTLDAIQGEVERLAAEPKTPENEAEMEMALRAKLAVARIAHGVAA